MRVTFTHCRQSWSKSVYDDFINHLKNSLDHHKIEHDRMKLLFLEPGDKLSADECHELYDFLTGLLSYVKINIKLGELSIDSVKIYLEIGLALYSCRRTKEDFYYTLLED